ncbi:MAG: recombinase family protein [Polyangiaceae bacterium]|nr:recombinase family protein [Polyangiaceae bacterium]
MAPDPFGSSKLRAPRCVIYARVSTARDQSPEMQVRELREIASQRGWQVVAEFVDIGVSGAKDRRPQLDALMKRVRRGVDIVAVYKFDRFARSVRHLLLALDEFRALGVDFVSARDGVDTSTPTGRFHFQIVGAVGELERELIRDRTLSGIENARSKGIKFGRPRVVVDVEEMCRLRKAGKSIKDIARILRVGAGTIQRALIAIQKAPDSTLNSTPKKSDEIEGTEATFGATQ